MPEAAVSTKLFNELDARMYRGLLLLVQETLELGNPKKLIKQFPGVRDDLTNFLKQRGHDLSEATMLRAALEAGVTTGPTIMEEFETELSDAVLLAEVLASEKQSKEAALIKIFAAITKEALDTAIKEDILMLRDYMKHNGHVPSYFLPVPQYMSMKIKTGENSSFKISYKSMGLALQRGGISGYEAGTTLKDVWDAAATALSSAAADSQYRALKATVPGIAKKCIRHGLIVVSDPSIL